MTLQELLDEHGLDEALAEETLSWARGRAAELVGELDPDSELGALLGPGAGESVARAQRRERPPLPSAVPGRVRDDHSSIDIDIDVPEEPVGGNTEEIDLDDAEIELLDDSDLDEFEEDDQTAAADAEPPPDPTPPPDRGPPLDPDGEPDLVALAGDTSDDDGMDIAAEHDPAVDALVASLDFDDLDDE